MALPLADMKLGFFDRAGVLRKLDAATKRALSRLGAYVRQRDKSSMRYETGKRKKSDAGQPPVVHRSEKFTRETKNRKTGAKTKRPVSPLRELTSFAYDDARRSVVIGPEVFRGSKLGGGVIPRVIEEGGTGTFLTAEGERKTGHFKARPHLGPAFRTELPRWKELFKNMLRK